MKPLGLHFGQELTAAGLNVGFNLQGEIFGAENLTLEQRDELAALIEAHDAEHPPVVIPPIISRRQFFQQLAIDGEITEAAAEAAMDVGTIPAPLLAAIELLPEGDHFAARMFLKGAGEYEISHPMTGIIAALMEWPEDRVTALWVDGAQL